MWYSFLVYFSYHYFQKYFLLQFIVQISSYISIDAKIDDYRESRIRAATDPLKFVFKIIVKSTLIFDMHIKYRICSYWLELIGKLFSSLCWWWRECNWHKHEGCGYKQYNSQYLIWNGSCRNIYILRNGLFKSIEFFEIMYCETRTLNNF